MKVGMLADSMAAWTVSMRVAMKAGHLVEPMAASMAGSKVG